MCEKGEGGCASGEDLLSEDQKKEREQRGPSLGAPRFFNARLIHFGPRLRHLLLPPLPFSHSFLLSHAPLLLLLLLSTSRRAPRAYLKNQRRYRGP